MMVTEMPPNSVQEKFNKINPRLRDNTKPRDLYFPPEGGPSSHQMTEVLITDSTWSYKNPATGYRAGEDFEAIGVQFVFGTVGDPEKPDGTYWRDRRFDLPIFEPAKIKPDGNVVDEWDEIPENQKTRIRIEEQRFFSFIGRTLGLSNTEAKELDYAAALGQMTAMIAAGEADGSPVVLNIMPEYDTRQGSDERTYQRGKAVSRISP